MKASRTFFRQTELLVTVKATGLCRPRRRTENRPIQAKAGAPNANLRSLEKQIDEVLTPALQLDRAGLESALRLFRQAGNAMAEKLTR